MGKQSLYYKPALVLGLDVEHKEVYRHETTGTPQSLVATIGWAVRKGAMFIVVMPVDQELDQFNTVIKCMKQG